MARPNASNDAHPHGCWPRWSTALLPLSLLLFAGCVQVDVEGRSPIANAGNDQSFPDDTEVTITLDATGSRDPDGTIVAYEWRYTGDPRGDEAPEPPPADADAGVEPPEPDPNPANAVLEQLGLDPLPAFCPVEDPDPTIIAPARWCELEPKGEAKVTLDVGVGVHRFTVWVTDDDGRIATDSVVIRVGVPSD